uniref:Uncharacterized protein n=1 Tax=Sphaerodactylus townsendi TaxID=933632 RepID=A0ACB8FUG5_9SAUR
MANFQDTVCHSGQSHSKLLAPLHEVAVGTSARYPYKAMATAFSMGNGMDEHLCLVVSKCGRRASKRGSTGVASLSQPVRSAALCVMKVFVGEETWDCPFLVAATVGVGTVQAEHLPAASLQAPYLQAAGQLKADRLYPAGPMLWASLPGQTKEQV